MNKIETKLRNKGWGNTRIDKISCPSWPEKHYRVSMWDLNRPVIFSLDGDAIGFEYADGDGQTISQAFKNLKRNIEKGYSRYFPGSYNNPVEKDYKAWKRSK